MSKVAIFIPTFKRAHKIPEVIQNIVMATDNAKDYHIYFIVEAHDSDSINMLNSLNMTERTIINKHEPCYAGAINTAYEETKEPYFFTGADDLNFHDGWLDKALDGFLDLKIGVVGTNDMGQIPIGPDRDATHYLVSREYILTQSGRADAPNTVLYPYDHNYTDKEFIETAKARGVYLYVSESLVEHLHPAWNKNQMDETYRKGLLKNEQDRQLYIQRQHLWQK